MHVHRRGIAAGLATALVGLSVVASAWGAGNTLRIDPPTSTVAENGTFSIKVLQNASVATSGAQATVTFDRTKVQVTTVTRGAPYANSMLFLGADAPAIAAANKSGKLKTVAAAFLPPGAVPAGQAEFLVIGFKAVGCGKVDLGLPVGVSDGMLLDGRDPTYGAQVKPTTTGGSVTVTCAAGGASLPPGASAAAPSGATPQGGVLGETFVPGASSDPLAPAPSDPLAGSSAAPGAATTAPGAIAGPGAAASQIPTILTSSGCPGCPASSAREGWLTFALAAMAIAAMGLAILIVLIVAAGLTAAVVGLVVLLRYQNRHGRRSLAAAAAGSEATGPTDAVPPPTAEAGDGPDSDPAHR